MNILILIIPITILLVSAFVAAFVWASGDGQYDDLVSPAHRMLDDESGVDNTDNESITKYTEEKQKGEIINGTNS